MAGIINRSAKKKAVDQDQDWKAQGFINITIPGKNGPVKLGSIALKDSKPLDAMIIETLKKSPEKITELINKMQFSFNAVNEVDASDFEIFS
jgi:hypothetical protein